MAVIVIEVKETQDSIRVVLHSFSDTNADTDKEKETAKDIRNALNSWFENIKQDQKEELKHGNLTQTESPTSENG